MVAANAEEGHRPPIGVREERLGRPVVEFGARLTAPLTVDDPAVRQERQAGYIDVMAAQGVVSDEPEPGPASSADDRRTDVAGSIDDAEETAHVLVTTARARAPGEAHLEPSEFDQLVGEPRTDARERAEIHGSERDVGSHDRGRGHRLRPVR